jgi:hopanoid biosynthesis associated radical SAM protein HpnH
LRIGAYIIKQIALRRKRFPLVLMLEPLFQCNLRCKGCGKIAHSGDTLSKRLTVDECVSAAEECGAPVVSIAGGEPLLHPDIHRIVRQLADRRIFVYLCTNALLVSRRIDDFKPSTYLTFNIHLDGLSDRHDALVCQPGVFDQAVAAIRLLISKGYRVTTNTTFYDGETPENAAKFLDFVTSLGVEGMTIAPGFGYEKAAAQEQFLGRGGTVRFFRDLFEKGKNRSWQFNHSGLYLDFLAGKQTYDCTPWGNPTRNIFGWQRPCYLLDDGYAESFQDLMETTDWSRYGANGDKRCRDCMVHCGFEPSAVLDSVKHPVKLLRRKSAA